MAHFRARVLPYVTSSKPAESCVTCNSLSDFQSSDGTAVALRYGNFEMRDIRDFDINRISLEIYNQFQFEIIKMLYHLIGFPFNTCEKNRVHNYSND